MQKMMKRLFVLLIMTAGVVNAPAQTIDPAQILGRAREAMGFDRAGGHAVHQQWIGAVLQPYQSDRTYPPFFSMMVSGESWSNVKGAVQRTKSETTFPGNTSPAQVVLSDSTAAFAARGNSAPVQIAEDSNRNLDAWMVIADWSSASDILYVGRENYRDYPRIVLSRKIDSVEQRLFLDPKTGFPVKLEYEAPHYLWGQQKVEYVFSNWQQWGGIYTANSSFRMVDAEIEVSRTVGKVELVAADSSLLSMPDTPKQAMDKTPMFLRPLPPTTVDVSANTKILSNRGYNEAVTVVGDEVFIFDATQGDERARQDREIIQKLYPSVKRFNVVVTDLAWPHVAGVRYWVANGATIISHRAAQQFLQQVIDRHWTLNPDAFEKVRKTSKFKFVPVDRLQELAGGKIRVFPIDGIGSEVALAAYIVPDHFLWASDYIQTLSEPTMYAAEVMNAVQRENIVPERVAAEHLPLNDWAKVVAAQQVKTAPSGE